MMLLLVVLAVLLVVFAPWLITRWVLIPLGLPRFAYYMATLADWTFLADRRGGAVLAGAWALCRRPAGDEALAGWLERKLLGVEKPGPEGEALQVAWLVARALMALRRGDLRRLRMLFEVQELSTGFETLRGAGIGAMGLLAAYRGDLAGARALLESLEHVDARACPRLAGEVALRWLAADAAARGAWSEVSALCAVGWRGGRDVALLGAVAARLLDAEGAPGDVGLWARWLLAPRRRATLALVQRALRPRLERGPQVEAPKVRGVVREGDRWGHAVALHAALLLRGEGGVNGEDLRRLGGAWDAVFEDEAARAEVEERARAIGASGAQAAIEGLRSSAVEDLVALVQAARIPHEQWDDLGEMLRRANRQLRSDLLAELELTVERLRRRVDEARALPAIDEWREWIALKGRYEQAAALVGMELRRLSFPRMNVEVCHLAVWLFNVRGQRALANAMFRWLLAEAEAVGDERAAARARDNLACGV
ncbi:hypothetical protein [Chondromyces apiculatus]|uniref:Uncharacterized protein n=1 Tax=Chondromyces apiculatus DSM 436 TaxID=1192034 RepID=A0A017T125_9BACT|nr:hypothetical protein [Chondromyces apiculatus]EYF02954.1 Hypothetical protein CAP_6377 [Chondromyces apiculatus DSM 436]